LAVYKRNRNGAIICAIFLGEKPINTRIFPHTIGTELIPVSSISSLISYLKGQLQADHLFSFPIAVNEEVPSKVKEPQIDFQSVIGHHQAKRALEIAAAQRTSCSIKWSSRMWEKHVS
jgi:predicted ATPase with chaperone activity